MTYHTEAPAAPPRRTLRVAVAIALLAALALFSIVLSAALGAADLRVSDVWRSLLGGLPFASPHVGEPDTTSAIVWEIRMPRAALAALVGAMLSLAGAAFQGLLRNPLADPYIVGTSSGAAVGASLAVLFGLAPALGGFGITVTAFLCALLGMLLVYAVARRGGRVQVGTFILAGVAVGSMLWSVITLALIASGSSFDVVIQWLMGSFADRTWAHSAIAAPFALAGWVALQSQARGLNAFTIGEEAAAHLGVEVERLKNIVLLAGSLLTAAAVSACGIVGFVGLVVPHLARRLFGADFRILYPTSALLGAALTLWADVLARMLLRPTEIPVGVVTAIVGAPLFTYLLKKVG